MKPINEDKSDMLIFLHIPKTAGGTLRLIMSKIYGYSNIYGIDFPENINIYKKFSKSEKLQYRVIAGHVHYGFHKYLPSNSFKYITMLRNPIERVISHYYYVLRTPVHYLHDYVVKNNLTLEEYVTRGISVETNQGQTRFLLSDEADRIPYGKCNSKMLKIAKRNLNKFIAVGIQEKFDKSLKLFAQILGWNITCNTYDSLNKGTNRYPIEEISINTLKIIEEYNLLDIELYNYALEIHNNLLKDTSLK